MELINYIIQAFRDAALFLFVGILPWIAVAFIIQLLSNSIRKSLAKVLGIRSYIYLTSPGVMIHELGHAFFCLVFGHKIVEMKLFSPEENGTLGYVSHTYNPRNFYQRIGNFFIGTGPIWFGIATLSLISHLLLPAGGEPENNSLMTNFFSIFFSFDFWGRWQSYLWLYLMLTIASHITLSPPDLSGSFDGGLIILLTVIIAYLLFGWNEKWKILSIEFCKNLFFSLAGLFAFLIIILLVFSIFCRLISRGK